MGFLHPQVSMVSKGELLFVIFGLDCRAHTSSPKTSASSHYNSVNSTEPFRASVPVCEALTAGLCLYSYQFLVGMFYRSGSRSAVGLLSWKLRTIILCSMSCSQEYRTLLLMILTTVLRQPIVPQHSSTRRMRKPDSIYCSLS